MTDTPRFWHLTIPDSTLRWVEWDEDMDYESAVFCPVDEGHQRAGKRLPNLSVILTNRQAEDDIIWTWQSECMLQEHVLNLFRSEKFTGFEVKPVKARVKPKKVGVPPRLWELVVTGWAGVAPRESGIRLMTCCNGCGHMEYSVCTDQSRIIVPSQWDGSDFFIVWPLPKFIFITQRVADVIRAHKLSGAVLEAPEDIQMVKDGGGFSPGRLSYAMPDARARELGVPLGIY